MSIHTQNVLTIQLSSELLIAITTSIIALIGSIISALIAKNAAIKAAKITATAEIKKLKLEIENTRKISETESTEKKLQQAADAKQQMISAISRFQNMPDMNTKQLALDAIISFKAKTNNQNCAELYALIQSADPFKGVLFTSSSSVIDRLINDLNTTE